MNIPDQKQFLTYHKDCFDYANWQTLTRGRRILLCSVTRFNNAFVPVYIRRLAVWAEMYSNLGVDQVYLVTTDSKLNAVWLANFAQGLPILGDCGLEFTQQLAQAAQITNHSKEFLGQYWNYQVLINSGEIEQLNYQPVNDVIRNYVRDTKNLGMARRVREQEKSLFTPLVFRLDQDISQQIFYYRLHPNRQLTKHLIEKTLP